MPKYTLRDGAELYVTEVGRGEPVVMLHGLAMDSTAWLPYTVPELHKKRFYIPDLRGWGKSRHLPMDQDYYIGQMADDVHDLILKIGSPKVALVGISMGAIIGLEYLKRYGDQYISRYLHIDAPAHLNREVNPDIMPPLLVETGEDMIRQARYFEPSVGLGKLPRSYQRKHHKLVFGIVRNSLKFPWQQSIAAAVEFTPIVRDVIGRHTSQGCWYSVLRIVQDAYEGRYDTREALASVEAPITNLVGTHDTLFPLDELKNVGKLAPNVETIEFDESGHLLMVTEVPKFMRQLKLFLEAAHEPTAYRFAG